MPRSRLALELTELLLDFAPGQRSVGVTMALHLCEAAIHKQFRSRDVAGVVGCEKHHRLRDLIGCPEPAERNTLRNHLHVFFACFGGMPWGRVDIARAYHVHANATIP